jgi:hypothetical protein
MVALAWDPSGSRFYENGADKGVLYIPTAGVYDIGYAWNGLTAVTESPSGAEATALWADNSKYLSLLSVEEFGGTIEAYTYPDMFAQCDGTSVQNVGVNVAQQARKTFGLSYRTKLGNDTVGNDYGYKIHLVYGALAAPSEKAFATVNDSPEAVTFSWTFTTTPVAVTGLKNSALLTVDSSKVTAANLLALENALYGTAGTNPRLPLPDEVIALFAGAVTTVTPQALAAGAPTFVAATGVATITAVTGITWLLTNAAVSNVVVTAGATTGANIPLSTGTVVIRAVPSSGLYTINPLAQTSWSFSRT